MEKDNITPKPKWEFDADVADCFPDMLKRSIPQHDVMRGLVYDIGCMALEASSEIKMLDIGCSNGLSLDAFVTRYGEYGKFVGIDVSSPMLEKATNRFKGYIDKGFVSIENIDLRYDFPYDKYSLITSILTIQFTPIEYRQSIIQKIYDNLSPGGCFIMVEKVLGECDHINNIMTTQYLDMKRNNGYSDEQINRKKQSLEGVLVPVTSKWNKELLKQAGFGKVDSFWRWMNFEGYIAIK